MFYAAGYHNRCFPASNHSGRLVDRLQAGATQSIDRDAGHAVWPTGQEQRHSSDISIVFTGLVGASEDDIVYGIRGDASMLQQWVQGRGGQVITAYMRQGAKISSNWGPHRCYEIDVVQRAPLAGVLSLVLVVLFISTVSVTNWVQ